MASEKTTVLYRAVGEPERRKIEASGWKAFPPRESPTQVFCPLESEQDAVRIARDWSAREERNGYAGFVLRFAVRNDVLKRFEVRAVGQEREHWVPSGGMDDFNKGIVGKIEEMHAFRGDGKHRKS